MVTGAPAYVIGAILTAMLPLLIAVAFAVGIVMAVQKPEAAARGEIGKNMQLVFIDVLGVTLAGAIVVAIGLIYGRDPAASLPASHWSPNSPYANMPPPADPNNPYNPPRF